MSISNGKLIFGLITFMVYYSSGSSDPFPPHLRHVLNYCALAWSDYYKKLLLFHYPCQVNGSAMGDASGKALTSFWKMSAPFSALFEEGSSCVVTDPPALGGLRALLSTLSPISNCEAGVLQMQQLFQKTKMKRVLKSFRQFRAREGFWTPSVDCNTTVAVLACLLFPLLFRCFLLFWDLFPLCIFLLFAPDEHKFI